MLANRLQGGGSQSSLRQLCDNGAFHSSGPFLTRSAFWARHAAWCTSDRDLPREQSFRFYRLICPHLNRQYCTRVRLCVPGVWFRGVAGRGTVGVAARTATGPVFTDRLEFRTVSFRFDSIFRPTTSRPLTQGHTHGHETRRPPHTHHARSGLAPSGRP
jgi:hypothetical protein|eukprot:7349669-Prymnesium_polylepis.1